MREPSLDPVRRPRLPRGRTTLRAALVAALLLTAAGTLYLPSAPGCPPAAARPAVTAAAATSTAQPAGGRLAMPAGAVGVPVRLAEPAALALLRPGDRVDLLAAGRAPALIADNALVLGVAGAEGAVFLAVRPDQARRAVGAPSGTAFGVVVRPP